MTILTLTHRLVGAAALDFTSTARALAVCLLGWVFAGLIVIAFGLWLTPPVS